MTDDNITITVDALTILTILFSAFGYIAGSIMTWLIFFETEKKKLMEEAVKRGFARYGVGGKFMWDEPDQQTVLKAFRRKVPADRID